MVFWFRSAVVLAAGLMLGAAPASAGSQSAIERVWFESGADLQARAKSTRSRALELGAGDVEAAARALISPQAPGPALENARAAVLLAPNLPAAQMALARAHWLEADSGAALRALFLGLKAIPAHLESSLWLLSCALMMAIAALLLGSALFIMLAGMGAFSHACHDLGDAIGRSMPEWARGALLASILLLPLCLGEGLLGFCLVVFALGFAYAGSPQRRALGAAAALMLIAMIPMLDIAGRVLVALDSDPVADASLSVVRGVETPAEVELLERAPIQDRLAQHALVLHSRVRGEWELNRDRYSALGKAYPQDPVLLTNSANLLFRQGDVESATGLYERASKLVASPTILFDLSQGHARSFQMREFESVMQRAQSLAPELVAELGGSGNPNFVADLPLPVSLFHERLISSSADDGFAQPLRRAMAPGFLGRDWITSVAGFPAAALIAMLVASRYRRSSRCSHCGARACRRCRTGNPAQRICESCDRVLNQPKRADPKLRKARLEEVRLRALRVERLVRLTSLLVPGAAGLLARRPGLGLLGLLFIAWAVASVLGRRGVVPDPLAIGPAGPIAILASAALALIGYFAVIGLGLLARRRSSA